MAEEGVEECRAEHAEEVGGELEQSGHQVQPVVVVGLVGCHSEWPRLQTGKPYINSYTQHEN